jgi:NitT/TauT family transport system ATP-binding protein
MDYHIILQALHKSYVRDSEGSQEKVAVLAGFDLIVRRHEFLTIFGPNGCGKSTLLNIIAGLTSCDAGSVLIDGKLPAEMKVGFVFQSFQESLFPWRTVLDNVAFPLELKGVEIRIRRRSAREFLDFLGIQLHKQEYEAYPYQLSGGQQQLVSIARALIDEPDVLIMDEPFNQLDYQTRMSLQDKVSEIWEKKKTTVVFVSHDIEEAIILGDRTVLLSKKPARVLEIMENDLERPRSLSVSQHSKFFALKSHALQIFTEAIHA